MFIAFQTLQKHQPMNHHLKMSAPKAILWQKEGGTNNTINEHVMLACQSKLTNIFCFFNYCTLGIL